MASYQKLVRDLIPNKIKENGQIPITRIMEEEEFKKILDRKLLEETNEYLEGQNIEELADMMEVIYTILDFHGWSFDDLERVRREKAQARGGFREKIYLEGVEDGI